MIRSLNTAATGMKVQQTNMDVIANNIANASTPGFKREAAKFEEFVAMMRPAEGQTGLQPVSFVKDAGLMRDSSQGNIEQTGATYDVAIVGAGPIGLMALMAARIRGAKRVVAIEVAEWRIAAAKLCGADAVIDPTREDPEKRALEITGGEGFDMVMECAGQPATVLMAAKLTRTRGRLVIMGVFEKPAAIDLTDVVFREKTISGSMSGYGLYAETIRMMTDPRFRGDLLITDHIGLDDLVGRGYFGLLNEKDKHVKMLVRPE